MEKNTYIIWKEERNNNYVDVNEVVGLFYGTFEEADALLEKLNTEDSSVITGIFGSKMYGYWRTEPSQITEKNYKEFLPN